MLRLKLQHKSGTLPTSSFNLVDNQDNTIGLVQIRHKPSNGIGVPAEYASHIYYEINKNERKKGYGTIALTLALKEANKMGIKPIIVTCDKNNTGSKKIIEKNGGILIDSCTLETGEILLKYIFQ
jgi:predicted acetyltransferase